MFARNRYLWFTWVVQLSLLASGCDRDERTVHQPDEGVRKEVVDELTGYYADLSARDWPAFSAHFWPGATVTTVWQPPGEDSTRVVVTSIPDFVAQAPMGPGSKPIFEERMLESEVRATANLAQVWARYQARFGDPGDVAEWQGIDAFTLMKHSDRWRIVSLVFASEQ